MQAERIIELSEEGSPDPGKAFRSLARRDVAVACVTGAFAFLVYALTAAPTVTAEDSGELAAAAWTLGIPHPPGYPLFTLLGKVFASLLPVGDVAYRLNILSSLFGGVAVGLVALLSLRLSATRTGAASIALVVAFTPKLWSQATITEVYALTAVLFLLVVHLSILFLLKPNAHRLWALAYVTGLSLTAHPSMVLLLPGVGALVVLRIGPLRRRVGEILCASGFLLLGFSIYLYLPLRSLADPAMDWGDPETLDKFIFHILRLQYSGLTPAPEHPVIGRLFYLGYVALFEVGAVLLVFSVLGLRRLFQFPGDGFWPRERQKARIAFRGGYSA